MVLLDTRVAPARHAVVARGRAGAEHGYGEGRELAWALAARVLTLLVLVARLEGLEHTLALPS